LLRHPASAIKKEDVLEPVKAKAIKLEELLACQKGAVVSREIISQKAGSITLFAFDKDQGLSEHTAPFDATVFCLEGEAEAVIAGKRLVLRKGDMVIMPAGKPHSLRAISPFKMLLIMIRA